MWRHQVQAGAAVVCRWTEQLSSQFGEAQALYAIMHQPEYFQSFRGEKVRRVERQIANLAAFEMPSLWPQSDSSEAGEA